MSNPIWWTNLCGDSIQIRKLGFFEVVEIFSEFLQIQNGGTKMTGKYWLFMKLSILDVDDSMATVLMFRSCRTGLPKSNFIIKLL